MAARVAASQVLGKAPQIAGVPFWTDAALLSTAGIPSLLFGPAGAGAHAAEEWVDLASVQACSEIYLQTASNSAVRSITTQRAARLRGQYPCSRRAPRCSGFARFFTPGKKRFLTRRGNGI